MPTSVMPKGVEHMNGVKTSVSVWFMPTSVMPKGVEHVKVARQIGRIT